jgi:hypothetical protein
LTAAAQSQLHLTQQPFAVATSFDPATFCSESAAMSRRGGAHGTRDSDKRTIEGERAGSGQPDTVSAGGAAGVKRRKKSEVDRLALESPGTHWQQGTPDDSSSEDRVKTRGNRRRVQLPPILEDEQQGLEMLSEPEGSLWDRALGLTQKLEERLKGFVEVEEDGEGQKKVEEDGEGEKKEEEEEEEEEEEIVNTQNTKIIDAIRSFREQVKDDKSSVRSCVVLLGHNGEGKSFFINVALQVCVRA